MWSLQTQVFTKEQFETTSNSSHWRETVCLRHLWKEIFTKQHLMEAQKSPRIIDDKKQIHKKEPYRMFYFLLLIIFFSLFYLCYCSFFFVSGVSLDKTFLVHQRTNFFFNFTFSLRICINHYFSLLLLRETFFV